MSKETEKNMVNTVEKIGFGTFSMSNNIVFNFKSLYYLAFLKMVLHIPVFWATLILTIGTIWDAINDPLIGFWSVNHRFKNGEKIRPLTLWFAIPWAITVVLLFVNFGISDMTWTIITAILVYLVFEAFYTFLCIPYNSMASVATNSDRDRRAINAYRSLGGCLGSGIGAVLVPTIVELFGGLQTKDINGNTIYTEEDAIPFLLTAVVMAGVSLIGCLFHYLTTRERITQVEDNEERIGFLETFKMLFTIKSWVGNMLFILCYGISSAIVMAEINDYASYIMGDSKQATPILAVYLVIAIVTSVAVVKLDAVIGRRKTMIFSAVMQVLGAIPFIIYPYSIVTIIINAAGIAIGATSAFVIFNTNRNNVSDIVEFKFHRRIDSMVATCDNLISKLAEALAIWVMGLALAGAGYDDKLQTSQPDSAKTCICLLLGVVPALVSLAMAFFAFKTDIVKEYNEEKEKFEAEMGATEA